MAVHVKRVELSDVSYNFTHIIIHSTMQHVARTTSAFCIKHYLSPR